MNPPKDVLLITLIWFQFYVIFIIAVAEAKTITNETQISRLAEEFEGQSSEIEEEDDFNGLSGEEIEDVNSGSNESKLEAAAAAAADGASVTFGGGHEHTKHFAPFGHIFNPIKDKLNQWSAFITHPNGGLSTIIQRPAQLWHRLQEKGSDFLQNANSAIFGHGHEQDYPFPYRRFNLVKNQTQI